MFDGGVIGSPDASCVYCGWAPGVALGNCGCCGGGSGGGVCGRGIGIGSLVCEPTLAWSTVPPWAGTPPGGVRRDGLGLRSSLTAGAWILAASAGGGALPLSASALGTAWRDRVGPSSSSSNGLSAG